MAEPLSSGIHCSQDGRSWTDPTFNRTFLAGARLEQYFKSLLVQGETPIDLRSAFLHEATHHWCFYSHVGWVAGGSSISSSLETCISMGQ